MDFSLKSRNLYFLTTIVCLSSVQIYALDNVQIGFETKRVISPSDAISAGSYLTNQGSTRPLLAISHDGGEGWSYPASVFSALPINTGLIALFTSASCSRLNCLASGRFDRLLPGKDLSFPLLMSSQNGGDTWSLPSTILSALPKDFKQGRFTTQPLCSGQNCLVAGFYLATNLKLPLLANSSDAGSTWTYPESIIVNLPTDFLGPAFFKGVTARAADCFAVGQYQNKSHKMIPLFSASHDGCKSWTYPKVPGLPGDFSEGILNSVVCHQMRGCIAVGTYTSTKPGNPRFPLVAISTNRTSWIYIPTPNVHLPNDFATLNSLNSINCGDSFENCIAVGQYTSNQTGSPTFPFLLFSTDRTPWLVPQTIITNLPSNYKNNGVFNEVDCIRHFCIAVGKYKNNDCNSKSLPLLATSFDFGETWTYPPSITANLPNHTIKGILFSVSCNVNDCVARGQSTRVNTLASKTSFPLIATSHDAGVTWAYPASVIDNLPNDYADLGIFTGGNSSFF